jgi:uncharacterized protein YjbI with pentapeptide repeats
VPVEQKKEPRKRRWRRGSQERTQESQESTPWTLREFGGKTVWDWMQLLIVPIVLSLITIVFTVQQDARQDAIETERAQRAQELENQRAQAERELENLRTEQATLQAYLDQMTTLLLDRNLRTANENSDVRRLARGRTIIVLDQLSGFRQVRVLRFLYEAKLIQPTPTNEQPVTSLNNASLPDIEIPGRPFLRGAHLQQANLSGSNLHHIDLRETYLAGAELQRANLENADLEDADLSAAFLEETDLSGANLADVDLSNAEEIYEKGTDLWKRGAGLRHADLSGANLIGADLSSANLEGADLKGANLKGAKVTSEQLDQAKSLEGATMTNGQKYEDWLQDKEGRGEDGQNTSSS